MTVPPVTTQTPITSAWGNAVSTDVNANTTAVAGHTTSITANANAITAAANKTSAAVGTDAFVAWDSFNRANSTTTLGTSDSGHAWSAVSGTWGINGNKGYRSTTGSPESVATIGGVGDGVVGADVLQTGRVAFRVVDADNYLFAYITGSRLQLVKRVAAVNTILADIATTPPSPNTVTARVEVSFVGDRITVFVNGAPRLNYTLTASEVALFPNTVTTVGMGTTSANSRWDNFYVSPIPKYNSGVISGVGSPEGVLTAPIGTEYVDLAATNGAIKWIKESGTTAAGWKVLWGSTGWRRVCSWTGGVQDGTNQIGTINTAKFSLTGNGWIDIIREGSVCYLRSQTAAGNVLHANFANESNGLFTTNVWPVGFNLGQFGDRVALTYNGLNYTLCGRGAGGTFNIASTVNPTPLISMVAQWRTLEGWPTALPGLGVP